MLRHILFDMSFFENESDRENSQKRVLCLLEALVWCNRLYLREHPDTPLLYQSGVVYKVPAQFEREEVPEVGVLTRYLQQNRAPEEVKAALRDLANRTGSGEHFREIPRIIENGGGDCFPLTQKVVVRSKLFTSERQLKTLEELRYTYATYEALSYNFDTQTYEYKDILGFVDKGQKEVCRARLSTGVDLVSTPDHKFWSFEGKRIVSKTMGDFLAMAKSGRASTLVQAGDINLNKQSSELPYATIRNVVKDGSQHVGCIEVSDNHNFVLANGTIAHNCDNLASWRVAELRELGISAKPYITWRQRPDGGTTYHVILLWPDGGTEDPSLLCGMGGEARAADRAEEQRKLGERLGTLINGLL